MIDRDMDRWIDRQKQRETERDTPRDLGREREERERDRERHSQRQRERGKRDIQKERKTETQKLTLSLTPFSPQYNIHLFSILLFTQYHPSRVILQCNTIQYLIMLVNYWWSGCVLTQLPLSLRFISIKRGHSERSQQL